jgi:hypothetical protein
MAALIVPIFWIGLYPATLLRRIEPSVIALRNQMQARGAFTPAPVAELAEASGSEPDEKATP